MFTKVEIDYPSLSRETIDGVRYYDTPTGEKLVSITSVISHYNREIFRSWRARVGNEEANKITKQATSRGTDMHTLVEYYIRNQKLPTVQPLSEYLFKMAKPDLDKIDNIHAIEQALFSKELGIAGSVDCIAEYEGELAVIDFKTSEKIKPEAWLENYFVQETFYAAAYYELTGIPVKKLITIMVTPGGEVKVFDKRNKGDYIKLLVRYIKEFVSHNLRTENGE